MRVLSAIVIVDLVVASTLAFGQSDATSLPPAVDLRPDFESLGLTAKSQGPRNTCSLFAITGLAEFEVSKASNDRSTRLSEEYLIWAANEAAGGTTDQAMFYEAVRGLEAFGICSDGLMPYASNARSRGRPSARARKDAVELRTWKPRWIKRWDVKSGLSPAQITMLKEELAAGHPVAVGLRWPKAARLSNEGILETPPADQMFDGHSVLFVGYRDSPRLAGGGAFRFRNSDGPGWGENGHAAISYDYVGRYANDALALHYVPDATPHDNAGRIWFEAEELRFAGSPANVQGMEQFGAQMWSGGKQLFVPCEQNGAIEFAVPVRRPQKYVVSVLATCAPDFGECAFAIDGVPIDMKFDGYSGRVHPSGRVELGEFELAAGIHRLRVTSVDRNPLSSGFRFGIDAVELLPVNAVGADK